MKIDDHAVVVEGYVEAMVDPLNATVAELFNALKVMNDKVLMCKIAPDAPIGVVVVVSGAQESQEVIQILEEMQERWHSQSHPEPTEVW